jgi:hypothetical protein
MSTVTDRALFAVIAAIAITMSAITTSACPIAAGAFTKFGSRCADDKACGAGFVCEGRCVPKANVTGEGEAGGEGEGEGAAGDGEGEGASGCEPTGGPPGAADTSDSCESNDSCTCTLGEACYFDECGPTLPACSVDHDCGQKSACSGGLEQNVSCLGTLLCEGAAPHFDVEVVWQSSAEIDVHVTKQDALGRYCMDATNDGSDCPLDAGPPVGCQTFANGNHSQDCGPGGAPLDCVQSGVVDCDTDTGTPDAWVHWGASLHETPSLGNNQNASLACPPCKTVIAVDMPPPGNYLVGAYFPDTGIEDSQELTINIVDRATGRIYLESLPTLDVGTWRDLAFIKVGCGGLIDCAGDLTATSPTCAP